MGAARRSTRSSGHPTCTGVIRPFNLSDRRRRTRRRGRRTGRPPRRHRIYAAASHHARASATRLYRDPRRSRPRRLLEVLSILRCVQRVHGQPLGRRRRKRQSTLQHRCRGLRAKRRQRHTPDRRHEPQAGKRTEPTLRAEPPASGRRRRRQAASGSTGRRRTDTGWPWRRRRRRVRRDRGRTSWRHTRAAHSTRALALMAYAPMAIGPGNQAL